MEQDVEFEKFSTILAHGVAESFEQMVDYGIVSRRTDGQKFANPLYNGQNAHLD